MKKSMYSLILADQVVGQIDGKAHQAGVSRSAYINQVLADHLELVTPEKQLAQVYRQMQNYMQTGGLLRVHPREAGSQLLASAPMRYSYNPTITYTVELVMTQPPSGTFRVVSRTQSDTLLVELEGFFRWWSQLESRHLPAAPTPDIQPGRYVRPLNFGENAPQTAEELAQVVSLYIEMFHQSLNDYLSSDKRETTAQEMTDRYKEYFTNHPLF